MKKETIIAIILGVLFGGVLGLFLIIKNKEVQLGKNKVIAPTGTENRTVTENNLNFQPLEISQPQDGQIFDKNSVSIKGKTTKNSLIIIQSPIRDMAFKNEKEEFSVNFPLALGENAIKIVVYPQDKKLGTQEKDIKVYYLQENL